mmetsp:Transcript_90277/g.255294  ORF Transcript_90277/g.255294 Transcript_90277/m.255294 type:complete len:225 (-) Transcript_90277:812-1486(-)
MAAFRSAISWVQVAIAALRSSMAVLETSIPRSSSFFWSSDLSSSVSQYSFLLSSSACSFLRFTIISSISLMTFSKPAVLPCMASSTRSISGPRLGAERSSRSAWARSVASPCWTCTKLDEAEGSVFLNSSSASSAFKASMVSDSATSSSARTLQRASHSAVFVAHPFSSSARNFSSCAFDSAVSSLSFFISAMDTASSPLLWSFVSIALVRALTSSVLAPMRAL